MNRTGIKYGLATGVIMAVILLGISPCWAYPYVRVDGRRLLTDFDRDGRYEPFLVKGMGYSNTPIGSFPSQYGLCWYRGTSDGQPQFECPGDQEYDNPLLLDQDLPLIKDMNANTIRTWGKVTPELLKKANELGLKVIAGYWIPHQLDYVNGDLAALEKDILDYVAEFKDDPAILMWGISNENEVAFCTFKDAGPSCRREDQAAAFYKLMNTIARKIKELEGESFHPVMMVSADLGDIGVHAGDEALPDVDVHGCNVYRGGDFGPKANNFFQQYEKRSRKPVLITEFGTDAWFVLGADHPERGKERPDMQAKYIAESWDTIMAYHVTRGGPNIGGVVFQYADGWWKYKGDWDPSAATHDCGYTPDVHAGPDGYMNEEWFGVMALEPNPVPGQLDNLHPRPAYDVIKEKFAGEL
ncbi:MAG TPA: hypothetical protein PLB05_10785 [Candidatus Omnitrophota bacterium]|nr:hypothetical protein [Candidatus Omnitrophota bacterium]